MEDRNNTPLPAATADDILKKINEVRAMLVAFLITLSREQRKELPKMGDRSLAFVQKAAELVKANPGLMPEYVGAEGLLLDVNTMNALLPILQALQALAYDVESTRMVAASEAYVTSLLAYGAFQAAAKAGQPVAQTAVEQLKPRFSGQGKSKKKDTPAA